MDESMRTRTLTRIAEEAVPDTADLWPALRAQVAAANQARPARPPHNPTEPRRHRAVLGGLASAAVLAVALAAIIAWWSQPPAVSAETILDRAQATADSAADVKSYHLKMTHTRGGTTVETEVWYGGSTKQRSVHRNAELGGASETIFNGEQAWIVLTENGRTRAVHTVGTAWNKPGDDPSRQGSLADVLAEYTSEKACMSARQAGEATVAGRPAYVIVTTPKSDGCPYSDEGGPDDRKRAMIGETRVWVDRESFVLLKSETRDPSGKVIEGGEVTSIEYNVAIPDSTFTYTPPPGVQTLELAGARPDEVKRALVEGADGAKDKDGAPATKKP